jgi:hypothetical protein
MIESGLAGWGQGLIPEDFREVFTVDPQKREEKPLRIDADGTGNRSNYNELFVI